MDKSNSELFKQAISEGLYNRFSKAVSACTDEVVCSERHTLAMRTIVYGKASGWRSLSPRKRRIIAVLVAAALLLTSCAVIFCNEIREFFEEFYVSVSLSDEVSGENFIEEVYELSYVPEGYSLKEKDISLLSVLYTYTNEDDQVILFEQRVLDGSAFVIDIEDGYSKIICVNGCDVYYRNTGVRNNYLWNDGKYALSINSYENLSIEEIELIIKGITVK